MNWRHHAKHPLGSLVLPTLLLAIISLASATAVQAQSSTDTLMMATLQRFKADTIYHMRLDTRDSTMNLCIGQVLLVKCKFTLVDPGDVSSFRDSWYSNRTNGWESVTTRKVWSGRPAVSDTVVGVVASVSKVNPELIARVMPRRFVVDLTDKFVVRIMTVEGAREERSFEEKMKSFTQNWIPYMRQPHIELVVTEKDAQTLYYALEPGTPLILIDK